MENRFYKSLENKLKNINFKDTYYEFNEIVIPIPNMLVDDTDPLVDIVEDEKARKEAKKFLKLSGYLNRNKDIDINVELENSTEDTLKGKITIINIIFKVHKDFNFNNFKDIIGE